MNKIDPARLDWPRVSFGDVVRLNKTRVSDPVADDIERYVGIEHIEPEDLRISSWGLVADGTTFTNYFEPGQVLFVKRRAYQRKVAVPDFAGVCSGDIYVLESKDPDVLLPELLPFLCQTERFFEHAVGTSAGSLSPRTNWTQLANYEFSLPPLLRQRRIAEMLEATQQCIWNIESALEKAGILEEALFSSLLKGEGILVNPELTKTVFGSIPRDWPVLKVSEIGDVAYGISAAVSNNTDPSIGWPILTGANITLEGTIDLFKLVYHPEPKKPAFILQKGDVLLNWRSGSKQHVGKAAIFELDSNWTYASFILRVRADRSLMNHRFLWRILNHMRRYELFGKSTSQQVNFKMNASYFRNVEVIAPPISVQDAMIDMLNDVWSMQASLTRRIAEAKCILSAVLRKTVEV